MFPQRLLSFLLIALEFTHLFLFSASALLTPCRACCTRAFLHSSHHGFDAEVVTDGRTNLSHSVPAKREVIDEHADLHGRTQQQNPPPIHTYMHSQTASIPFVRCSARSRRFSSLQVSFQFSSEQYQPSNQPSKQDVTKTTRVGNTPTKIIHSTNTPSNQRLGSGAQPSHRPT